MEGYASIGGGSPLRQITDAQVQFYLLLFHLLSARAAMRWICLQYCFMFS
jgi:hypothetical protein